jgi:SAM-dependent methyltransferase
LRKCRSCKSAFIAPIPTEDYLNAYYASSVNAVERFLGSESDAENFQQVLDGERRFPNSTVDAARIAQRLRELTRERERRALDVGCGHGFFSRALREAGFDVTAIELNEKSRAIFKLMNGFDALNVPFDARFAEQNTENFDIILLSQVLEHLPMDTDPIGTIERILSPGGICVIAVPHFRSFVSRLQGRRDMFICPPEHLNFFTIEGLENLFGRRGFRTLRTETISRFDKDRMTAKFKALAPLVLPALSAFLKLSDTLDKGLFINSYFQKI